MVKINGVDVDNDFAKPNVRKPTINEILDRMESNYQHINNVYINSDKKSFDHNQNSNLSNQQNNQFSFLENTEQQKVSTESFEDNSGDMLLSILPMMLSKNKSLGSIKNSQDKLFEMLLKKSNNPRLSKFVQLLPKILNKTNETENFEDTKQSVKNEPKIESFKKTDDFEE